MHELAIWVLDWLKGLKGALPSDLISAKQYPEVYAWIERFNKALSAAKAKAPNPTSLKGPEAAERISKAAFVEQSLGVDSTDPLGLEAGQQVRVWPIDSGSSGRDTGRLVGLDDQEVVIENDRVRVHFPRTGFRIVPADVQSKL